MQRKTIIITDPMESWVKAQWIQANMAITANILGILFVETRNGVQQKHNFALCIDDAESSGVSIHSAQETWVEAGTRFIGKKA